MDSPFFKKDKREEDFDIRIDRNGQWFHQNSPIKREKIAKLFSTILHFDTKTGDYWLITPHEQGRVAVEDVPYVIIDFTLNNDGLSLVTNLGQTIIVNKNHPIECNPQSGIPYVVTTNNVKARLNRAVREKLITYALDQNGYDEKTGKLTLTTNDTKHIIATNVEASS